MENLIICFKKLFEKELNEKNTNEKELFYSNIPNELYFINNNNDAFNLISNICFYFKLFLYFLYEYMISYSNYINYFLYQIQINFLTIIFIIGFVLSFDINSNSNISTNLIISAYFDKNNYTRVTYEQVLENEKNGIKYINVDKENDFSFEKILISILCFFALLIFIKLIIKSRIKNFIFFNSFGLYITFHLTQYFYKNKNYFASSFMLILLIFFDKNLLDAIFIKLSFQRKDFEIFSNNLISHNIPQFILKFLSILNISFISIILSILYYNFWVNYFLIYLCILSSLSLLGNSLEKFAPFYLKPFKNIIMFLVGVFNIILSKIFLKKIIVGEQNNSCFYSLYLINDLFSAYCINFINNYIEYQYKYIVEIIKINDKNITNNYFLLGKNMNWFIFLCISIFLGFLGIFTQEYIPFILSLYTTKKFVYYFSHFYNIKLTRILNNIIILNFFTFIPIIARLNDFYFVALIKNIINLDNKILSFSLEFIFLLLLIYYIITTNFILYIGYYESEYKMIINQKNTNKIMNIIYLIIEILIQFLIMYLIIILYKHHQKKLIINVLNTFSMIIYHLLKIPSINELKSNDEENISYNIYMIIWVIVSLILIELSGPEISLIYLVNHINLIIFINFYILNETNNNIFKILVIFFLLVDYYRLHSCLFIIDAIAIIIYPIIKNMKLTKGDKYYNSNEKYRINADSIKAYNKLTFSFALFLLLFALLEII